MATCYLVAPTKSNIRPVIAALKDIGIIVHREAENPPPGEQPLLELVEALRAVDFVCGIVGSGNHSGNALFELGVAAGLEAPIFIIVDAKSSIPSSLLAYPHVVAPLEDVETLRFHLDLFVRNLHRINAAVRTKPTSRRRIGKVLLGSSYVSSATSGPGEDTTISRNVAYLLRDAGFNVTTEPSLLIPASSYRPDIVAWGPSKLADFGNPILFEVYQGSPAGVWDKVAQVRHYLELSRLRTGVIVLIGFEPEQMAYYAGSGYVFLISLRELNNVVSERRFPAYLRDARSKLVHGSTS